MNTHLIEVARKAENWLRNFACADPGACLTAGSEQAEACDLADELAEAIEDETPVTDEERANGPRREALKDWEDTGKQFSP